MKGLFIFKARLLLVIIFLSFSQSVFSIEDQDLNIEVIASGLGVPWGMALMPDNTMLITQRHGELSLLNLTTKELVEISGLPAVKAQGQGGLFDVVLPPDYKTSSWIYFSYAKDIDGQAATTLARAKLNGRALTDWQDLLVTQSTTTKSTHFGGRIVFDNHGHLFLSIGDRGVRADAQNNSNHIGTIIRLKLDGSIPEDNPFVNDRNALNEIWSYGHRNPQGLFFNQTTKQLWGSEHGPRGGDEINLIKAGKNYGWPVISHGKEYWGSVAVGEGTERADIEAAIKVYTPSIATSGLIQYSGKAFPDWQDDFLSGALNLQHLNRISINKDGDIVESRHLTSLNSRIRNVIESPEGWLYIATDQGQILTVKPR